jgi:CCDC93, coiled-coil domain
MATWSAWDSKTSAREASGVDQTSAEEKALQQQKLDETVGLLLGAGYFRARLPRLPAFDKVRGLGKGCVGGILEGGSLEAGIAARVQVVGGLCWSISSSGESVDVDIFYDEDLALGQKMCVAEAGRGAVRGYAREYGDGTCAAG